MNAVDDKAVASIIAKCKYTDVSPPLDYRIDSRDGSPLTGAVR